jgi:signal transduction histidine kinase
VAGYYLVAEAVTNAVKHARASVVRLTAVVDNGRLCLTIRDDGVGGTDPNRGSGPIGVIDRVQALGGTMTVTSAPEAGTVIDVELPLEGVKHD